MANNFLNHLPHTDFGAKMNLTREQEEKCKVVYKLCKDKPDIYVFDSLWDPDQDYSDDYVIVPLRSTAASKVHKNAGYIFSNVIGSSLDPKPCKPGTASQYSSWLQVFIDNRINCDVCKTDGKFYDSRDDHVFTPQETGKTLNCNNTYMKGGHVIPGKQANEKAAGDPVELIPICAHHNSYTLGEGEGNGTGFYMKLAEDMDIIQLTGYLPSWDLV